MHRNSMLFGVVFVYIMSGMQPVNSSAVANDIRTIFEKLTYGPAPEADNVAQVFAVFNCYSRFTHVARLSLSATPPSSDDILSRNYLCGRCLYFKYILTIFSATIISQPGYSAMIRLCADYCSVNFHSSSYVLYCVRYPMVAVCQLFNN